ncbi:MAG: CDP-alcohol phosphatidyltransferase family protein [Hyphomicrobiaceae bacterium]|nr:CDP-alcohol phosphatidyltransferase family protein [Hyphomicrobiaceae bacterium]
MGQEINRRPLKTRSARWAGALAGWLSAAGFSPNGISVLGVLFAALGAGCFLLAGQSQWFYLGAAAGIQLRLVANLLDGMVAIEGGKASPTGPLFNEFPDRIEDALFLIAAGYAAAAPQLGYGATILAVATAYIRASGGALGLAQDFTGPMAKQQRMFVLTVAAVASAFVPDVFLLEIALWVIVAGSAITCIRRSLRIARLLKGGGA